MTQREALDKAAQTGQAIELQEDGNWKLVNSSKPASFLSNAAGYTNWTRCA